MPVNVPGTDQFPANVRAPANNEFASQSVFGLLAQDLADRTLYLFNRVGNAVQAARQVLAGDGLAGGGNLASDRTLSVLAADGSIVVSPAGTKVGVLQTDAQHGDRGGSTLHALATTLAAGFMSPAHVTALGNKADQSYVDAIAQGLDPKPSVDAVATTNLTLSGLQTVDSKALTAGMRCGAFGQTDAATRGIYIVSAGAWTRSTDADTSAEVTTGMYTWTSNGANKGGWWLVTPDPIVLGTTALTFERYTFGLSNSTPPAIGQAGDPGSDTTSARGGHTHAHGAQPIGDGTNHAAATTTLAGFMSPAQVVRLASVYQRPIAAISGNYTATLADVEKLLVYSSASNGGVTIAPQASVAWPDGAKLYLAHHTTGVPNFLGPSVTLVGWGQAASPGPGNVLVATRMFSDVWSVSVRPANVATSTTPGLMSAPQATRLAGVYQRPINFSTTPAISLALAHAEQHLYYSGASPGTWTIPAEADVAWPSGAQLVLTQYGAQPITIAGAAGVTVNPAPGMTLTTPNQYSSLLATKLNTNLWMVQTIGTGLASAAAPGFQSPTDKARADLVYSLLTGSKTQRRQCRIDGWTGDPRPDGYGGTYAAWQLRGAFPVSISMPSGGNSDQLKWLIDLQPEFPPNATAITSFDVRLIGPSAQTVSPPFPTVTPPNFVLASYDASGNRTVEIAAQSDTTATLAAYKLPHSITWSGSVAFNPAKRYVLEFTAEQGGQAQNGTQLIGVAMGVEYYSDLDAMINAMAPNSWFRADSVTTSGANTTALKNRAIGASDVMTVTGTLAAPASDSALNGQPSIVFTGSQRADTSRASSTWKFLHDGTGSDVFHVFVPTSFASFNVLHSTGTTNNSSWAQMFWGTDAGTAAFVSHPAGTRQATLPAASLAAGVAAAIEMSYSNATAIGMSPNDGKGSGDFTAFTPSSSNPEANFRISGQSSGAFQINARWAETLVFDRVLSAIERQYVREYIQARYGITASIATANEKKILAIAPQGWARMDTVTLVSGAVDAVHDKVKHGHRFAAATAGARPAAPAADATLNGAPSSAFGSTNALLSNAPASFWKNFHDGSGAEAYLVVVPTSFTGGQILLASRITGPGLQIYHSGSSTLIGYVENGAAQDVSNRTRTITLNVANIVSLRHGSTQSPNVVMRLNGSETSTAYTFALSSATSGQSMAIGASTGSNGFVGRIAEVLLFPRVLSAAERADVIAYTQERYGVAA